MSKLDSKRTTASIRAIQGETRCPARGWTPLIKLGWPAHTEATDVPAGTAMANNLIKALLAANGKQNRITPCSDIKSNPKSSKI
ncbi:MAG: hypothetical protein D6B27_05555 [Gammaproteobacteria bacterium]|nr:MAG: hypothetical protein D6B27_05555 [Gammaproteobacteria bacterium]